MLFYYDFFASKILNNLIYVINCPKTLDEWNDIIIGYLVPYKISGNLNYESAQRLILSYSQLENCDIPT
jgi:hypothetical protein